jgi:ABC-2 type transport system ATP-binding protein
VILSTHILQEVEAVCSRVLILNEGKIAAQGAPEEIAGTLKGGDRWELILRGTGIPEKCAHLGDSGGAGPVIREKDGISEVSLFLPDPDGERIFDWAVAENLKILGMNRRRLSLEDIFVKLTRDEEVSETGEGL